MNTIDLLLIKVKYRDNVGLIYRLAYQFNIRNIYTYESAPNGKTDTYKTERHIPIHKIDSLEFLRKYPFPKYLLETGGKAISKVHSSSFLLAVANESFGASTEQKAYFDAIFSLTAPNRESYNVSHALAIGLYILEYGI
jgi:tRNA G18 (ribose-2'-O)-methylase SpoU